MRDAGETGCRLLARIREAKRPVIFAGTGVRLAGALEEFEAVIRRLRIPVVTAWTHDLIASDDGFSAGGRGRSASERETLRCKTRTCCW